VVFLVFSIIAKTAAQKKGSFSRGGRVIVLGSGGFTEQPINAGGLAVYSCPAGKIANIKGNMIWTVAGASPQLFVQVNLFDNVSGRNIPQMRINTLGESREFEFDLLPNQDIIPVGSNGSNDATAEWLATITELPN